MEFLILAKEIYNLEMQRRSKTSQWFLQEEEYGRTGVSASYRKYLLLHFGAQSRSAQLFCRVIVYTNLASKLIENKRTGK